MTWLETFRPTRYTDAFTNAITFDLLRSHGEVIRRAGSISALLQNSTVLQVFLYLNLLDVMTTLLGLRLGCAEANPFIATLMQMGPAAGLAMSKGAVICVATFWVWSGRAPKAVRVLNYGFALLVLWNLRALLVAVTGE